MSAAASICDAEAVDQTVGYRTLTRCKEEVLLFRFPLGKWSLILTEIER